MKGQATCERYVVMPFTAQLAGTQSQRWWSSERAQSKKRNFPVLLVSTMTRIPINRWWFLLPLLILSPATLYISLRNRRGDRVIIFLCIGSCNALFLPVLEGFWGLDCSTVFLCSITHAAGSSEVSYKVENHIGKAHAVLDERGRQCQQIVPWCLRCVAGNLCWSYATSK